MNVICLVAAIVCAIVAALLGFGAFSGSHTLGWVALSLAFGWAGLLFHTQPWPWTVNRP